MTDRIEDGGQGSVARTEGRTPAARLAPATIECRGPRLRRALLAVGASSLVFAVFGTAGASAKPRDRDRDGMPDRWELRYHLKVNRNDADRDPDRDGVDNRNEYREHSSPRRRDSDRDGVADGREDYDHDGLKNAAEDRTGNDPADPDSDNDGVKDGKELTGRIVSFDGNVLTIRLARGKTVEGLVSDSTEISCESEDEAEHENELDDESGTEHSGERSSTSGRDESDDDDAEAEAEVQASSDDESSDRCSASALRPGTAVQEAEGQLGPDGLEFTSVKLVTR